MSAVDPSRALTFLAQYPPRMHARLLQVMQRIGFDLQGYVQREKLQGQVLKHRTGWLSSHVLPKVQDDGHQITTTVGVDGRAVPYAAAHEYGFHGSENVRAHTRTISMVFGREVAPTTVNVAAFTRQGNTPERSYLRSSLRERLETYKQWLKGASANAAH